MVILRCICPDFAFQILTPKSHGQVPFGAFFPIWWCEKFCLSSHFLALITGFNLGFCQNLTSVFYNPSSRCCRIDETTTNIPWRWWFVQWPLEWMIKRLIDTIPIDTKRIWCQQWANRKPRVQPWIPQSHKANPQEANHHRWKLPCENSSMASTGTSKSDAEIEPNNNDDNTLIPVAESFSSVWCCYWQSYRQMFGR